MVLAAIFFRLLKGAAKVAKITFKLHLAGQGSVVDEDLVGLLWTRLFAFVFTKLQK